MYYISTKFGFIASFCLGENFEGEQVTKAKHCIDVREALPFRNRSEAEQEWRRLGLDWWHCVVSSDDGELRESLEDHIHTNIALRQEEQKLKALLLRAADSLQDYCAEANGDMNDGLALEIYKVLGVR